MKKFDTYCAIVGVIGFVLMFHVNTIIMQVGMFMLVCVAVAWLNVRVTGPHLEQQKRNGRE